MQCKKSIFVVNYNCNIFRQDMTSIQLNFTDLLSMEPIGTHYSQQLRKIWTHIYVDHFQASLVHNTHWPETEDWDASGISFGIVPRIPGQVSPSFDFFEAVEELVLFV